VSRMRPLPGSSGTRDGKRRNRSRQAAAGSLEGELGAREALRRLWPHLRALWAPLLIGLAVTLAASCVNLSVGGLVSSSVETIRKKAGTGDIAPLNSCAALALLVFALRAFLTFATRYAWAYSGQKLSTRLRNALFAHVLSLPISFFDRRRTGQVMSSLSNDIPAINKVFDAIQDASGAPVTLVGGLGLLFWLNWPLALAACIFLPPAGWVVVRATRRIRGYSGELQAHLAEITAHAEETIAGIRTIRAFGNEEHEARRFRKHSASVLRSVMRTLRVRLVATPVVDLLAALTLILVFWAGGYLIIHSAGSFTLGDMAFFAIVLQEMAHGARNLGQISVNLGAAAAPADRVFTLLAQKGEVQEHPAPQELGRAERHLRFCQVGFAYQPGHPVLQDVSFQVEIGQVVALVGPTGSGKTTVASLILRLYDPTAGTIEVDGVDTRRCRRGSLRRQIAAVPQEPVLFHTSVRDNIAYGCPGAREAEIIRAAELANAWEFIEKLPGGLDTLVGDRGVRLSGGQRQRIALARAILPDPRILILDEATSSLDAASEVLIQQALQRITPDRITLVIAHRLSTVRLADRILVLKEGRIVEAGRHGDLLASGGLYAELYCTQTRE
jgi:ATP-binding cassette, subfamily B, bacterial MsbA